MKKLLAILFLSINAFSQDTLSCKKDLTWEKGEKYYYKTSDESKQRYTGPAKCYPNKGVENRGFLKDGAWEGKVFGYKGNLLLGFSTFVGGFYEGLTLRYDENGLVKDSTIFKAGFEEYSKKIKRDKDNEIKSLTERFYAGDTLTIKYTDKIDASGTMLLIEHYLLGKKNGSFEEFWVEEDENKNVVYKAQKFAIYKNGVLICKRYFDDGVVFEEEVFENKKLIRKRTFYGELTLIESEENYVDGKLHGDKRYFDVHGKVTAIERFENGKSIEMIEY